MAYDTPIPGFNTYNTNNLRLWKSKACGDFDFDKFVKLVTVVNRNSNKVHPTQVANVLKA